MLSPFHRLGQGLLLVAVLIGAFACKDQQKCDEALKTSRTAMKTEFLDMKLARQWREHAGKICGAGPELAALDKEIVDKEAALQKEALDKAEAEKEAGQKAIEKAQAVWRKFDKLDKRDQDAKALNKSKKAAGKLIKGLTPDYAKQVKAYNSAQYKKRKKRIK